MIDDFSSKSLIEKNKQIINLINETDKDIKELNIKKEIVKNERSPRMKKEKKPENREIIIINDDDDKREIIDLTSDIDLSNEKYIKTPLLQTRIKKEKKYY